MCRKYLKSFRVGKRSRARSGARTDIGVRRDMTKVNNRLDQAFANKNPKLSIFFTAGYPKLESTTEILDLLQNNKVDFVEIGFPFSDPVADGEVIQKSNLVSLANGMTLEVLFQQLKDIRKVNNLPLILMGYFNPVEQFGFERFLKCCQETGIDGLIIPDLPLDLLSSKYKEMINAHNMHFILLVTPTSSDQRIREIDQLSTSFIYAVSSTAVTGGAAAAMKTEYFERLKGLNLNSPITVGFGIDSKQSLEFVHQYSQAGIVGSAFLRAISQSKDYLDQGREFLSKLL